MQVAGKRLVGEVVGKFALEGGKNGRLNHSMFAFVVSGYVLDGIEDEKKINFLK